MEFTTHFGLHSQTTRLQGLPRETLTCLKHHPHGPFTLCGPSLYNRTHEWTWSGAVPPRNDLNTTLPSNQMATGFGAGLFPVHSPLLRESLLVSFPPLSDMLKFSGYSRLIRGQVYDVPYARLWVNHRRIVSAKLDSYSNRARTSFSHDSAAALANCIS